VTNERRHLTKLEVDKLIAATKGARNEARDQCLLILMFRHGLRVSEACGLTLAQIDTESRQLRVIRLKKGLSTIHPLRVEELRFIKAWLTQRKAMKPETDTFFISERRAPCPAKRRGLRSGTTARLPGFPSQHTRTCSGTPVAMP
jgi:type 1 fimbriae regulatory protein FimB